MVASNQASALKLVLAHEGGYVNHPKDPGGATNKGVTQKVYDTYRSLKGLSQRSVRSITSAEVAEIYDKQYWDAVKGDSLPAGLDYAVFDYGVNSGPSRAVKDLQRTLNANFAAYGMSGKIGVDGNIGSATVDAACKAANADEEGLIVAYCKRRMSFFKSLKTWGTFGKGWTRRVMGDFDGVQEGDRGVVDYAVMMARGDLSYPIKTKLLPAAIGEKDGEVAAKAPESKQAALKTPEGLGAVLAGCGAGGQTLVATANETIKPHINGDNLFGRLALIAFVLLILVGVGLIAYNWYAKQKEKAST